MAGDWMKFEKTTLEKPEVFQMAGILGIDPDAVVGKLLRVWNWFDDQSRDGHAHVTVVSLLDRYTGVTGFAKAMESVRWMIIDGESISLPNYARHNGEPAKVRALARTRKQNERTRHGDSVTETGQQRDKHVTREEKRREENNNPPKPPRAKKENAGQFPLPESVGRLLQKLYNRRENTPWGDGDCKAAKNIQAIPEPDLVADIALMSKARSKGWVAHRQDPATLMNNWQMEIDRANNFLKSTPMLTNF